MRRSVRHLEIVVAVLLLVWAGCGPKPSGESGQSPSQDVPRQGDEAAAAPPFKETEESEVKIEQDTSSMSARSGAMSMVIGEKAKVPDGFPKDVPVYPGLQISMAVEDASQEMYTISGVTSDPLDKVVAFLKDKAPAQQWEEMLLAGQEGTESRVLMFGKENRVLTVSAAREGSRTNLTLSTGKKE